MNGLKMKYFVLNPTKGDRYGLASRKALSAYADSIGNVNRRLAEDLRYWIEEINADLAEQSRDKTDAIGIIRDKIKWLRNVDSVSNEFIHSVVKKELKYCADIINENLKVIVGENE